MEEHLKNIHQNSETPGNLKNAFDAFAPELPAEAWNKLENRRKKRRRILFWWFLSGLALVLISVSGWFLLQNQKQISAEKSAISNQPTMKTQTFSNQKDGHEAPAISSNPIDLESEKQTEKGTVKQHENATNLTINASDSAIEEAVNPKPEKLKPESGISSSNAGTPQTFPPTEKPKIMEKEMAFADAKKKTNKHKTNEANAFQTRVNRQSHKETAKSKAALQESAVDKSIPFVRNEPRHSSQKEKENFNGVESIKNEQDKPETIAKKQEKMDEISGIQQLPVDSSKAQNQIEHTKMNKSKHSSQIIPDSGLASKKDTAQNQIAAAQNPDKKENIAPDSGSKRKIKFECTIAGLAVNQTISLSNATQADGKSILSLQKARHQFGGSFGAMLQFPLSLKWHLFAGPQLGVLYQSVQFEEAPGPASPIKLIKTDNGIEGIPAKTATQFWKENWLFLPSAKFEIGYQINSGIMLRGGIQAGIGLNEKAEKSAAVVNPGFGFACLFKLFGKWDLRTEIQSFRFKNPVSNLPSQSENLIFGVGLKRTL